MVSGFIAVILDVKEKEHHYGGSTLKKRLFKLLWMKGKREEGADVWCFISMVNLSRFRTPGRQVSGVTAATI